MRTFPVVTAVLALAALAAAVEPSTQVLQYDRTAAGAGQYWRLLTCQWTHWSIDHLAWDLTVFTLFGVICERQNRRRFVTAVLVSALVVPALVHFALPRFTAFRGLSGVDCALVGLAIMHFWKNALQIEWKGGSVLAGTALLMLLGKILAEVTTGHAIFVDSAASDFAVVPEVHLVGMLVGVAVGLVPGRRWVGSNKGTPCRNEATRPAGPGGFSSHSVICRKLNGDAASTGAPPAREAATASPALGR